MSRPSEPVFLERQSYRRRRLGDAAKVLPVIGVALLLLPILWADDATTAGGILFIFSVWAMLIAAAALISRRLSDYDPMSEPTESADANAGRDGSAS